jgi:hypothetical protein
VHPHFNQPTQPGFTDQIDVGLADARRDAHDQTIVDAVFESLHRLVEDVFIATSLVADDFAAFDADQRCAKVSNA